MASPTVAEDDLIVPSTATSPIARKRLQRRTEIDQKNTCGICFGVAKPAARLDGCAHRHCFTCILKLSKTCNKCPFCRSRFSLIVDEDNPMYSIEVKDVDLAPEPPLEASLVEGNLADLDENGEEPWGCAGCGSNHDEANVLVCDGCEANGTCRTL